MNAIRSSQTIIIVEGEIDIILGAPLDGGLLLLLGGAGVAYYASRKKKKNL